MRTRTSARRLRLPLPAPVIMRRLTPLVALGIALVVAIAAGRMSGGGGAASASPADEALALTHEVMSPFCPGLTLAACPSPSAYELRVDIRRRFDAGETRASIFSDLVRQFGPEIDGTPPTSGLGAAVWAIPFIVAAALGIAIRVATRGAGATSDVPAAETRPAPTGLLARLEDELERMD